MGGGVLSFKMEGFLLRVVEDDTHPWAAIRGETRLRHNPAFE